MPFSFDPFSLSILPPILPGAAKANFFIAGMLLNRISYHFVEIALFAKNRFLDLEIDFQAVIQEKLECLDGRIQGLRQYDNCLNEHLEPVVARSLSLRKRCNQLIQERKKVGRRPSPVARPSPSEYAWSPCSGYPLSSGGEVISRCCHNLVTLVDKASFRAGYLVDRFTHGSGNCDGEGDYCYSNQPVASEVPGEEESEWSASGLLPSCIWEECFVPLDLAFLRCFRFDNELMAGKSHFQGESQAWNTPAEWADAVVSILNSLAILDDPDISFHRLKLSMGNVILDGSTSSLPITGQVFSVANKEIAKADFAGAMKVADLVADARFAGADLSQRKIIRWISTGVNGLRLKAYAVGRTYYVRPEDLVTFCQARAAAKIPNDDLGQKPEKKDSAKLRADLLKNGLL